MSWTEAWAWVYGCRGTDLLISLLSVALRRGWMAGRWPIPRTTSIWRSGTLTLVMASRKACETRDATSADLSPATAMASTRVRESLSRLNAS